MFTEALRSELYFAIVNRRVPDMLPAILENMCEALGDAYLWQCSIAGHGDEGFTLEIDVIDLGECDRTVWRQFAAEVRDAIMWKNAPHCVEVAVNLYGHTGRESTWPEDG